MKLPCALLLLSLAAFGQKFEAADVHASAPNADESGGFLPGGQVELHGMTMLRLIGIAYNVDAEHVAGGPSWISTDKFDIIAKAPGTATRETLLPMLQALLADRFGLAVSHEERPFPIFKLLPGSRTAKLKASANPDPGDCKRTQEAGELTMECHGVTIANLSDHLRLSAAGYFNHPVIDETGYKGSFDFTLHWHGRANLTGPNDPNSLFVYLEKELGIKVAPDTKSMPVIAISKLNETPTPNDPEALKLLVPPPAEFEVGQIHPFKPGTAKEGTIDFNGGRFEAFGVTLKTLVSIAYNFDDEDRVMGDKWLSTDKFDAVGKSGPTASGEALRGMLKNLLIDRFKLVAHNDTRQLPGFALTLLKNGPKLPEAAPGGRSECKLSVADALRTYTCTNTTMAQFADKIRTVSGNYLDKPVADLTGLKGAYDFAVSFSPYNRVYRAAPGADEPLGGITLFEGLKKIGLEMNAQKVPLPVIVVDKAERVPIEKYHW